jgi:aminoglycoside phosphotransferase family enzyme
VDFTSLALRRHYCEEELRLNRRLSSTIYLGVVAITGNSARPRIGAHGAAIEYAVKMRQFPQTSLLSATLAAES